MAVSLVGWQRVTLQSKVLMRVKAAGLVLVNTDDTGQKKFFLLFCDCFSFGFVMLCRLQKGKHP